MPHDGLPDGDESGTCRGALCYSTVPPILLQRLLA